MKANLFKLMFMDPRPDWNRMGPRLPAWWRAALKRIDPQLDMQFMPPVSPSVPDGVDVRKYPHGVWVVVRKLRFSRLLHKTWVWCLTDELGNYRPPGKDGLRLIAAAYRMFRTRSQDKLERVFDRSLAELKSARSSETKDRLYNRIAASMRKMAMPNSAGGRMFNPWGGNGQRIPRQAV
jgi:hypothetical protein